MTSGHHMNNTGYIYTAGLHARSIFFVLLFCCSCYNLNTTPSNSSMNSLRPEGDLYAHRKTWGHAEIWQMSQFKDVKVEWNAIWPFRLISDPLELILGKTIRFHFKKIMKKWNIWAKKWNLSHFYLKCKRLHQIGPTSFRSEAT